MVPNIDDQQALLKDKNLINNLSDGARTATVLYTKRKDLENENGSTKYREIALQKKSMQQYGL